MGVHAFPDALLPTGTQVWELKPKLGTEPVPDDGGSGGADSVTSERENGGPVTEVVLFSYSLVRRPPV